VGAKGKTFGSDLDLNPNRRKKEYDHFPCDPAYPLYFLKRFNTRIDKKKSMIPTYDDIMLPLLITLADGKEHAFRDLIEHIAKHFKLNDQSRNKRIPNGQQARFDNHAGWAKTYLKKARLIESPRRGQCKITRRGMAVLRLKPKAIDTKFLKQFPEFDDFMTPHLRIVDSAMEPKTSTSMDAARLITEERLDLSYQTLRQSLATGILEKLKRVSPAFFEHVVVDVLVAMGYGGAGKESAKIVGRSGDGGVDGIIKEDKLGLDLIYIQAKRWENPVGRPEVQAFAGSLEGFRAKKGVFITTSRFTQEARDYVEKIASRIILIDGEQLAGLMIDANVGVADYQRYVIKKLDVEYFDAA
jgi:restriction system protein